MQKVIIDVPTLSNIQNITNGSIASALIVKAYKNGLFLNTNMTNDEIARVLGQESKTGQWLYGTYINEDSGHYYAECSECHSIRIVGNYCPNCGAKMIGSDESEG